MNESTPSRARATTARTRSNRPLRSCRLRQRELACALCLALAAGALPGGAWAGSPPGAVIQLANLDGTSGFRVDGAASQDRSGWSVATAGDLDGDGIDDFVIGAPYATLGSETGRAYVVFGRDGGFPASLDLGALDGSSGFRLDGVGDDDLSGWSVAGAGDVNGDGLGDLVVGAPGAGADIGNREAGCSFVVFGRNGGFSAGMALDDLTGSDGFRIDGAAAYDASGTSVAAAGDINGDGFGDLLIGAPNANSNGQFSGSSYVVFGHAGGFAASLDLDILDGTNGFRLEGESSLDSSGLSVAGVGDVDGDGFDDVVVGARSADQSSGRSYVVFGAAGGFPASIDLGTLDGDNGFAAAGGAAGDASGHAVAAAGDVNGDGFADVMIGAPRAAPNGSRSGSSYVVFGHGNGFAPIVDLDALDGGSGFRMDGATSNDYSGHSVAGVGDFNGDGFGDVLVGAYRAGENGSDSGSSYLVYGHAGAFPAALDLDLLSGGDGVRLDGVVASQSGWSVAGAGDVDGDGAADLLVGAPQYSSNGPVGSSYVVFGYRTDRLFCDGFDGSACAAK